MNVRQKIQKIYKPSTKNIRIFFYIILIVVFILAVIPKTEEFPEITRISDKLNHFAAFLTLAFLIDFGYPLKGFFWKVMYLGSYGLIIEVAQYFLPYREFSLFDLAVDIMGLSFYFLIRATGKKLLPLRYKVPYK